jgi:hypothetical protein
LYYYENNNQSIKIWIAFKFETHKDSCKYQENSGRLIKIANCLKEELKNLNLNSFKDEDAFCGIFSRPKIDNDFVSFNFYLNKDYPQGYWYNHTL